MKGKKCEVCYEDKGTDIDKYNIDTLKCYLELKLRLDEFKL